MSTQSYGTRFIIRTTMEFMMLAHPSSYSQAINLMLKLSLTFSGYHPYGLVHQPLVAHLNGAVVPAEPIEVQDVPLSLPKWLLY